MAAYRGRGLTTPIHTDCQENQMTNPSHDLFVVDVDHDGHRTLHGPIRKDVADRFAAGVRAAGSTGEVLPLTLADPGFCFAGSGAWPPRGFRLEEIASIYVEPTERFVVSFIQGYDYDSDVSSAEQAVEAAVLDTQLQRPTWFVFDRQTGALTPISQPTDPDPATDRPAEEVVLSGRALAGVRRDLETVLDFAQLNKEHDAVVNGLGGHILRAIRRLRAAVAGSPPAAPATRASRTSNGYDPRWVEAISRTLADRGSTLRAVDLDDNVWGRFLGPLVDTYEDSKVAGGLVVDSFDEGAEGEHAARDLGEGPDFDSAVERVMELLDEIASDANAGRLNQRNCQVDAERAVELVLRWARPASAVPGPEGPGAGDNSDRQSLDATRGLANHGRHDNGAGAPD